MRKTADQHLADRDWRSGRPARLIAGVAGAIVAGSATAKLLHDFVPGLAWLTAAGLCLGLHGAARLIARQGDSRLHVGALLALGGLTFSYLLVLGGESMPRPAGRDALAFVTFLVVLLTVLTAAAALPVLIVAAALWRTRTGCINERVLSRWAVAQPSPSLRHGLERLRQCTGFEFTRILCLDDRLGGGRLCGVMAGCGRARLLMSQSLSGALTSDQLLALLAHEAAHVRLGHSRRKLVWGLLGTLAVLATGVAGLALVSMLVPRTLGFASVLIVLLPLSILRGLYDTFVVRRHEAEADAFAVDVAGASALLEALAVLGASRAPSTAVHDRWTTHGTWERRASRIAALGRSRAERNLDERLPRSSGG